MIANDKLKSSYMMIDVIKEYYIMILTLNKNRVKW